MRKQLILTLCMALGSCITPKKSFNLSFGSGFKENIVPLKINDIDIMGSQILNSDPITGVAGASYITWI